MDLYHSLLWFIFVFQVSTQSGPVAYAPFFNTAPLSDNPTLLGTDVSVLVNRYMFSCNGTISQWQAYVVDNGSHPIEFHVWRNISGSGGDMVFLLVGSNTFSNAEPAGDLLILEVPPEERFDVQAGDFIGIRSVANNATESNFRIQTLFVGLSTYYFIPDEEDTPSVLMLTGMFHFSLQMSPLINVVFERPNVQGIPVTIVVATSVSGFALIVAIFIVALVVCCLKLKRKRIDLDTDMENNRAYVPTTTTSGNTATSSEEMRPQSESYVNMEGAIYDQIN